MTQQRISEDRLARWVIGPTSPGWPIYDLARECIESRALLAQKDAADAARADHSTHFEGCWRHHLGCAVARIEAQDAEIAALKKAVKSKDRVIDGLLQSSQLPADMETEI